MVEVHRGHHKGGRMTDAELENKAEEIAIKFMKDCFYDVTDKDANYKYNIDTLIGFVKNGVLLGHKEGYKDYLKGNV